MYEGSRGLLMTADEREAAQCLRRTKENKNGKSQATENGVRTTLNRGTPRHTPTLPPIASRPSLPVQGTSWTALPPKHPLSEIHSFYLFSHFELFFPTNTHFPNAYSHLHYALTTCSLPFISFRFHHSHQVQTIANTSEVDSKIYQR